MKIFPNTSQLDEAALKLTSVGVDVGTTTSNLIISELTLEKLHTGSRRRFAVTSRTILHRGEVFLTPLTSDLQIDMIKLSTCFGKEFERAGIAPDDIDTGAVIITGESAKRENAEELVQQLRQKVGKFVCAAAGPNFESMLAARGSGAVEYSKKHELTILNCDIGGGTSNIALIKDGEITDSSCINVGARLVVLDEHGMIAQLEEPIKHVAASLGMQLDQGSFLAEGNQKRLASKLQNILFEALTQTFESNISMDLMMTSPMCDPLSYDAIMFSGGVGEYIYGKTDQDYGDLGRYLAEAINTHKHSLPAPVYEPPETIRATIIGAGQYTLQVSGVTTYVDSYLLPLHNLPVIIPKLSNGGHLHELTAQMITDAYQRLDLNINEDLAAIYFRGPIGGSYSRLATFSKTVVQAVEAGKHTELPLVMVFEQDIGNSVGNVMVRETALTRNIISIDELEVCEGDFIDIGIPKAAGQLVPVVIKTLIFRKQS
ncbi:MAG: ethanolamine ammonia-lyase reactivating factor EutA [Candidatus Heimdallarchaeota archaeon]